MAKDLALTTTDNDISFDNTGNFVFVDGDELTAQRWRQTLETRVNEWAFQRELGIDYLGQVLVKNPDIAVIRALFIDATVAVPGIAEVLEISLDTDDATRRLIVNILAKSDLGNPIALRGAEVDGDFVWTQL